jgi:hypothetical protein
MELSWAKAKRTHEGIEVWGQVQQVHCCRSAPGYIVLEAKNLNGGSLASTNTRWGDFNPRQVHSAWFKAVLPLAPAASVSAVAIQFKIEAQKGSSAPILTTPAP